MSLLLFLALGVAGGGNRAELLVDREEVFPEALAMIRGAEREVLLGMYLLGGEPGPPPTIGWEIVEALAERAAAGVDVRVINQRFAAVPDRRAAPLADDPWFHPVFDVARGRGLAIVDPCTAFGAIDHTKHLIVDGEAALFGGMNLADAVASNHDVMLRVEGPLVGELRGLFARAWRCAARGEGGLPRELGEPGAAAAEFAGCEASLLETTPSSRTIRPGLRRALGGAGRGDEVRVAMLLLTDGPLIDALVAARRRGATVRVLLDPNAAFYGVDCEVALNARAAARLAEAGVEVRLYDALPGQELHMKALAIREPDGGVTFGLGSANWTTGAMLANWETYAIFEGCPAAAERMWSVLAEDWGSRSRPVEEEALARWRQRAERAALAKTCRRLLREESFRTPERD